MPHKNMAS